MKWLLMLLAISLLPVGCVAEQPVADVPQLTPDEVINIIWVYGIPYDFPFPNAQPTGGWAAVYEGEGQWRIQGSVFTHIYNKTQYWTTTWTYKDRQITLVSYART